MDWVSIARGHNRHRRLLWRTYCAHAAEFEDFLKSRKLHKAISHKVDCENDLLPLLEANLGIGVLAATDYVVRLG